MNVLGYELDDDGCGDNSCLIKKPVGMATNGGCRCTRVVPGHHVLVVRRELDRLAQRKRQDNDNNLETTT